MKGISGWVLACSIAMLAMAVSTEAQQPGQKYSTVIQNKTGRTIRVAIVGAWRGVVSWPNNDMAVLHVNQEYKDHLYGGVRAVTVWNRHGDSIEAMEQLTIDAPSTITIVEEEGVIRVLGVYGTGKSVPASKWVRAKPK